MVEQSKTILQTDLSAVDRLYHTEQLQELQALMADVLATGQSNFSLTTKRRKGEGMAVCVKAQNHNQFKTEKGTKVEGGTAEKTEAPREIVARRRLLAGGHQTGFRAATSDPNGLTGYDAPMQIESTSAATCEEESTSAVASWDDMLTMNFSEIFEDEQAALF